MSEWTRERVLAAYKEWQALNDHAEEVANIWIRLRGWEREMFLEGIALPGWRGTGWPGDKLILFDLNDDHDGRFSEVPLSHLWEDGWREEMRRRNEEWAMSAAAAEQERNERLELARLKAKYERSAEIEETQDEVSEVQHLPEAAVDVDR